MGSDDRPSDPGVRRTLRFSWVFQNVGRFGSRPRMKRFGIRPVRHLPASDDRDAGPDPPHRPADRLPALVVETVAGSFLPPPRSIAVTAAVLKQADTKPESGCSGPTATPNRESNPIACSN